MASNINQSIGETVGYQVRFENKITAQTKIEVVTEGLLLRKLHNDQALEEFGLIIFDEFHERSLDADLSLALCLNIQRVLRPDLKILIMSATIDSALIASAVGKVPVIKSEGRQFPVEVVYWPEDVNEPLYIRVTVAVKRAIHAYEGDVLVFLPGAFEIQRCEELLSGIKDIKVCALYGDLSFEKQREAIEPDRHGMRKVILSTSIAETSLTIEGVKLVIDSGFSRKQKFDGRTGLSKLETVRVTADTANQRTGRAGRVSKGVSIRLWSQIQQANLVKHLVPEIMEADLSGLLLHLFSLGETDVYGLPWVTEPPDNSIKEAETLLKDLHAIENNRITKKGTEMVRIPVHPRIAHMIAVSKDQKIEDVAVDIASILEEKDPLERSSSCNLVSRIDAIRAWRQNKPVNANRHILGRIQKATESFSRLLKITPAINAVNDHQAGYVLSLAYPDRIGMRIGKTHRYRLSNGMIALLAEHDPLLHEEWIVAADMGGLGKEMKIYLAAPLDVDDISEMLVEKEVCYWNDQNGELIAQVEKRIGEICVSSKKVQQVDPQVKINILNQVISKEGIELFSWTDEALNFQARVSSARKWNVELPDLSNDALLTNTTWVESFLTGVKTREDFKKLNLLEMFKSMLTWEQLNVLDEIAPLKIRVPSGSEIALNYNQNGSAPVLSVRLQELFGMEESPAVNKGKVKVLLHLLSPGYKPVQVTQDLKSFWNNTYKEVRKELKIRYPRHSWPEDPWKGEPVRGPVKRR
jgi:ATP-dependent helicase HrpB